MKGDITFLELLAILRDRDVVDGKIPVSQEEYNAYIGFALHDVLDDYPLVVA